MELGLQILFVLQCTAILIGWDPATPPPFPPHLGSYTRTLLVSQDRRHPFETPFLTGMVVLELNAIYCIGKWPEDPANGTAGLHRDHRQPGTHRGGSGLSQVNSFQTFIHQSVGTVLLLFQPEGALVLNPNSNSDLRIDRYGSPGLRWNSLKTTLSINFIWIF